MTERLILLVGIVVVGLWWFIAWQLSREEAELPLFGPDDDRPAIKRDDIARIAADILRQEAEDREHGITDFQRWQALKKEWKP